MTTHDSSGILGRAGLEVLEEDMDVPLAWLKEFGTNDGKELKR